MNSFKKLLPLIVVMSFSFWSIRPLLNPGFFPMHDDTQVARVFEMHKALSHGMFPVRWVPDLGYGYGYPIFNFYAPLAYYIGAKFMFLGMNALLATKAMIGLGTLLAGVFMYLFAKDFWGKKGGIVSALLYVYAPYHALNIYVRGAIGELWAYVFIPLVFLGLFRIYTELDEYVSLGSELSIRQPFLPVGRAQDTKIKNPKSKVNWIIKKNIWSWVCLTSISYAAIITSHNLTAMMVTPFIFIFSIFLYIKLRSQNIVYKPYFVILGLLIGFLLSAFYSLPVLFEMKYTDVLSVVGGGSDYKDHFACLPQLWNSPWGFAGSAPGCLDGLSLKIGKLHVVLGAISLFASFKLYRKEKFKFQINVLFLIFLAVTTFLTLKESKFIWNSIPHMAFFQFPWRFLILITFFMSFLGGAILWALENARNKKLSNKYVLLAVTAVVSIAIVFVNEEIFIQQKFTDKKTKDYVSKSELNWRVSKISDEYMPQGFLRPIFQQGVPKGRIGQNKDVKILSLKEKSQQVSLTVNATKKTQLHINIAYFPGWHVYLDGKQVWFRYSNTGLIIDLPSGRHDVEIKFTQTPVEKVGNIASLTGVMVLLAGIIGLRKK